MHVQNSQKRKSIRRKRLLWATLLNLIITVAEVIGGILSNSLALLSDALHNLGDTIAVFLAYVANRIAGIKSSPTSTFGYKRIEIIAALFNAVVLIVITIYLFIEAYNRFINPSEIKGAIMLGVAIVGFLANLVAVLLLHSDSSSNINVKAAYLHLLGDTLSSVAVIAGGILILFFDLYWIDPLVTVLIGIYILYEAVKIIRESLGILMQITPKDLDLKEIKEEVEKINNVKNIHHIHAWKLTDQQVHFEAHVDLSRDVRVSEAEKIREQIETLLVEKYTVHHVTLQIEYGCNDSKSMINDEGL